MVCTRCTHIAGNGQRGDMKLPDGITVPRRICFPARNRLTVKSAKFSISAGNGRGVEDEARREDCRKPRKKERNRHKLERHYLYLLIAFASQSQLNL